MSYVFYELLIYESPPETVPRYKKYENDELQLALEDFYFVKQLNVYDSIYLMKITIKDDDETRERIKEYIINQ